MAVKKITPTNPAVTPTEAKGAEDKTETRKTNTAKSSHRTSGRKTNSAYSSR